MKRRIRLKPRFWVLLAILVIGCASLLLCCKANEEPAKIKFCTVSKVEAPAETEKELEYILDIPLSCELQEQLYGACQEFGVDYYVMVALIDRETQFQNVKGDGGASYGYCQIQPRWWYGLMTEIGATDLMNPKDNFRTGCAILSQLTAQYHSIEGGLVSYNQGWYKGYSTDYSREIIANAEKYRK